MEKIRFKIIEKCFQDSSRYTDKNIDFYLEKDDWNDYGYCTTYHLHSAKGLTPHENRYIGPISIMMKGQEKYAQNVLPELNFTILPDNFCSVSLSVEFYQNLVEILSTDDRFLFSNSLRLIMGANSPMYENFKDDPCFVKSLLRDSSIDSDTLKMGNQYLFSIGSSYNMNSQTLIIKLNDIQEPFKLNFSCADSSLSIRIPEGIGVFIGKNGSGKSTALYKIAKLLYASPKDRHKLTPSIGEIRPYDVGFSKLIMISFSTFDNFVLPGLSVSDYRLITDGIERGNGRFVFCGIRDIEQEFNELLAEYNSMVNYKNERQNVIYLKNINILGREFVRALLKISNDIRLSRVWNNLINNIKEKQTVLSYDSENFELSSGIKVPEESCQEAFSTLSTGHKFFFHALANLIAYCEKNSMVIFDEPENHLHPPLLSFMINEIRTILKEFSSVMLIATHSPVILQETFSSNIRIFRRDGIECSISKPIIETYGENIGTITSEVFDLTVDDTEYHEIFEKLYNLWECKYLRDSQAVIDEFEQKLGCQLSNQMSAYLIGKKIQEEAI